MTEIAAPQAVVQNIEATKVKKQAEDLIKATRDETVEYFRAGGTYPGVTFSESQSKPLNEKIILQWAYENLPKETYDQLFTKVFDPNSFAALVDRGMIKTENMPANYQEIKLTPKISVKV